MASTIQSAEAVRSVGVSAVFAAVSTPALVAHQGGWDEALLIGTPILAIVGLLWLAKRRVEAAANAGSSEPSERAKT
jgi:cyanate permease